MKAFILIFLILMVACSDNGSLNITVYKYQLESLDLLSKNTTFYVSLPKRHSNNLQYHSYKELISKYLKVSGLKEVSDIDKATYVINFDYQLEDTNVLIGPNFVAKTIVNPDTNKTAKTIYYSVNSAPVHYLTIDIFTNKKLIFQTQAFNTTADTVVDKVMPFLICASFDKSYELAKYQVNYARLFNFYKCPIKQ
jgi:hypothetical protein